LQVGYVLPQVCLPSVPQGCCDDQIRKEARLKMHKDNPAEEMEGDFNCMVCYTNQMWNQLLLFGIL
jgi:hypothetical protein